MVRPLSAWGPGVTSPIIYLQSCWALEVLDSQTPGCATSRKICEVHQSVTPYSEASDRLTCQRSCLYTFGLEEQLSGRQVRLFLFLWVGRENSCSSGLNNLVANSGLVFWPFHHSTALSPCPCGSSGERRDGGGGEEF